jgi:predicted acylesterase/phospholipase RssA
MAMTGAIEAALEKGYHFECVYGNSMGALVGGLYASAPSASLSGRYRNFLLFARNEIEPRERTRFIAEHPLRAFGVWLGLLDPPAMRRVDPALFRAALDDWLDHVRIEAMPVSFGTSHLRLTDRRVELVTSTSGSLADAISGSVAHPEIFEMGHSSELSIIDPGVDRAARVPVDDAWFGPARLLVVNLTDDPVRAPPECPTTVIAVPRAETDDLSASSSELDDSFRLGADAAHAVL